MDTFYYIYWDHVQDEPMLPIMWSRVPHVGYRRVWGTLEGSTFTFEHNWQEYKINFNA